MVQKPLCILPNSIHTYIASVFISLFTYYVFKIKVKINLNDIHHLIY